MIEAGTFLAEAARAGFDFYTGVPCSFLTPLINGVLSDPATRYVGAASEGEAVAIAAGAWLAGRRTVVMCQNSGLGNAVNPLTSLNAPFRIPTLFVTTWRGQPGIADEPQHALMGTITHELLRLIGVDVQPFPADDAMLAPAFARATTTMAATRLPVGWVVAKGDVAESALAEPPLVPAPRGRTERLEQSGARPTRAAALEAFLGFAGEADAVIATTGKCGRELFTLADRPQHLYQVGSMGGASAMALGVALNTPQRVFVLDGDGAALMKLGSLATIGAQAPANLIHILLDNGVHDSTGGQATVSPNVDFAGVAIACGYRFAASCDDLAGFERALRVCATSSPSPSGEGLGWGTPAALRETGAASPTPNPSPEGEGLKGPVLIHLRIAPGSMAVLGRPTIAPADVALRFKAFLASPLPA